MTELDVVIVGAGQSGLALGYFLARLRGDVDRGRRQSAPTFVLLDERDEPGGAWPDGWGSLRLFSPASMSSLPGWPMPPSTDQGTPSASHVAAYLAAYEARYDLPVHRPEHVQTVARSGEGFLVTTDLRQLTSRIVVMAGGTWGRPFVPVLPGIEAFAGRQLHASGYRDPDDLVGQKVLVVGAGNSAAQIAADLAPMTDTTWVTREPPRYLPDDVDGRALFQLATQYVAGAGRGVGALGDIVVTPPVHAARAAGLLKARRLFEQFTVDGVIWSGGDAEHFDAVIWCTGFHPDLRPVLGLTAGHEAEAPATTDELPTESADVPGLFFLGYGDWCGTASATLVGVGAPARATARRIDELLYRHASM